MSIIAPHECLACRTEGLLLCGNCQKMLPLPPPYNGGNKTQSHRWIATAYEGCAKRLVQALKFERKQAASAVIAAILADRIPLDARYDAIVHLPTATRRIRARGYDQAALIAGHLSKLTGVPHHCLLARTGQKRQLGQSRTIRLQQMQGVFYVPDPAAVRGRRLLLIDDVVTTGASLHAATAVLRQAGASHVAVAVFAAAR